MYVKADEEEELKENREREREAVVSSSWFNNLTAARHGFTNRTWQMHVLIYTKTKSHDGFSQECFAEETSVRGYPYQFGL